jgi:hypothetical protein
MVAHLSITLDAELYARLKKELPPKRISAFIEQAVLAKLGPDRRTLNAAYKAASREKWRCDLADDWSKTEVEAWSP